MMNINYPKTGWKKEKSYKKKKKKTDDDDDDAKATLIKEQGQAKCRQKQFWRLTMADSHVLA